MRGAAEKRRKEGLKEYFSKTFNKDKLPGELTVGSRQFVRELEKV